MDKAMLQYCKELKAQRPFLGLVTQDSEGHPYKLLILGRGENASYQEDDRAIIFEIHFGSGLISTTSMRRWDSGTRLSTAGKTRIADRVANCFRAKGIGDVTTI
jgi:hypothetical protein